MLARKAHISVINSLVTWPVKSNNVRQASFKNREQIMNAAKTVIRDAATLIIVARNSKPNSHFDYRILLLKRADKSAFMVGE